MTNTDNALRELMIEEATLDIRADAGDDQEAIFDLYADHAGSDLDAWGMIHDYAQGIDESALLPRTIAFLRILTHDTDLCIACDEPDDDTPWRF